MNIVTLLSAADALLPIASRVACLGLLVLSIYLFARTVNRRLLAHFPRPWELPPGSFKKRLGREVSEVLFQSRVIRNRPVAGVLHALVLWGFIAFAWISAEHFWLGFRGLDHAEPATSWYAAFVAVWAVAVLIGIGGLSFRRFILRPTLLGELSITSAVVASLISVLMVTYLLGWREFAVDSSAWKINWWIHTLAFCALLVVIPQSKHLHLVLAPFAIFFRPDTTSSMRPLREDVDDDFGMIRFKDMKWKDVLDVNACVECGRCTQFCPANVTGGSLSPKHITLDMQHGLLSGGEIIAGPASEKSGGSVWIAEEDLFQCLSCGACENVCPVGIEHVGRKILDLRRGLVSEGRITNEKVVQLFTTMERAPHNPWGISQDTRQKFITAKDFPIYDGSQTYLLWMGCGLSFDAHGQQVALAMKQILDSAGVSWGVLERESCCGEPARRGGNEYLYLQLAEEVTQSLEAHEVKNIIACCPHCTTMFDKDYRQIASYEALGISVMHHTELIASLLPEIPLDRRLETVTYHDPCYLARHRGITDAPREILRHCGISITEMAQHGKDAFCCGAGGTQIFIADDRSDHRAERVNQQRFAQAMATGAPTIAVACPYCPTMFQDAATHARRDDVAIVDVAEMVASRLKEAPCPVFESSSNLTLSR